MLVNKFSQMNGSSSYGTPKKWPQGEKEPAEHPGARKITRPLKLEIADISE
jgi:hypothetical protein